MTLTLLRRDEALRTLPGWAVVLLPNAAVLAALLFAFAARHRSAVSTTGTIAIGWLTVAVYLVLVSVRPKAGALNLTLPIPARRLWLLHLVAIVVGCLVLVGGFLALLDFHAWLLRTRLPRGPDFGAVALLLGAAAPLAAVLLHLPNASLARVPVTASGTAWRAVVLLSPLGLLPLLTARAPAGALVLLAALSAAVAWGWRSVPPAFVLVAREPAVGRSGAAGSRATSRSAADGGAATAALTVLRCLTQGPREILVVAMLAIAGFLLGGADALGSGDYRDMRFLYLPIGSYLLFTAIGSRLCRFHHLDPLPLSRRLLFAGLTLPATAILLASFGAGAVLLSQRQREATLVDYTKPSQEAAWRVTVPLAVYEIAWDGRVPRSTSPWGESHAPEAMPLLRGTAAVVWNPYSTPPGSSSRFVALQISRAFEAVYGVPVSADEIERRDLDTLPDGTVVGRAPGLRLPHGGSPAAPRTGPVIPLLAALILVPAFLLVAALHRTFRAAIGGWAPHVLFWGVVGLFLATMGVEVALLVTERAQPWAVRAILQIPARGWGQSTAETATVWVACVAASIGAYLLAELQFRRAEMPSRPLRFSLLDRAREESR